MFFFPNISFSSKVVLSLSFFIFVIIYEVFFFLHNCTTDLHNSTTKSKLNIRTTEPYLIYNDHIGENNDHKYCLQSFLAEVKHSIQKPYVLCVLQRETIANV